MTHKDQENQKNTENQENSEIKMQETSLHKMESQCVKEAAAAKGIAGTDPRHTIGWIIKITVLLAVVLIGLVYFIAEDPMPMVVGLVFGTAFSILNFRLLHLTIQKSLAMSPNQAKSYVSSRYIIRYLLAGAMLFAAITNPSINVLGAILGLLIIKVVIFSLNFIEAMKKGLNKQT